MTTLRISRLTGSGPTGQTLQISGLTGSGTLAVNPTLQISRLTGSGAAAVIVNPLTDSAEVEPRTLVHKTASLYSGSGATTWLWTQVSGPTTSFSFIGPALTAIAPDVMPDDPDNVAVLQVTATIGGVTSPAVQFSIPVRPQLIWSWTGTTWIGANWPD